MGETVRCKKCRGTGQNRSGKCSTCNGTGKVTVTIGGDGKVIVLPAGQVRS